MKPKKTRNKKVPWAACKALADKYGMDQVIVLAFSKSDGLTHVATYGKTLQDCEYAAIGGNTMKKFMCWPDELCRATPSRIRRQGRELGPNKKLLEKTVE